MKYIAIKEDSFVMITPDSNEGELIAAGFQVLTQAEYGDYITFHSAKTMEESLAQLETKAQEYIKFGEDTWETAKRKVFAVNTYNKSIGNELTVDQMKALLSTSDMLEKSLKSGSLNTAKDVCNYFKYTMPQYSTIADYVILEINKFMGI